MQIIFAYFDHTCNNELVSVCEGFDNFNGAEQYLVTAKKNFIPDVVSFIAPTLDECWDALERWCAV